MKASEFINVVAFSKVCDAAENENYSTSLEYAYKRIYFFIPRLYCVDGFSISVQVNQGNYCASENGGHEFGFEYKLVEWGYPSEPIDGEKFNAEDPEDTTDTVGMYVEVELIEELCEQHGGFDYLRTLKEYSKKHQQ